MKKNISIILLGLMVSACTSIEPKGRLVSVLEDCTETDFIAQVESDNIIPKFGLENDPWQSSVFRYGTITSLTRNRIEEVSLPNQNNLLGNELERRQLVKQFKQSVQQILEEPRDYSNNQYSSIWKPIVRELEVLQSHTDKTSTLYVFSDLFENSHNWFSVYQYKDLKVLRDTPEKVVMLFLNEASSVIRHNLNIEVIVVFQPKNIQEDDLFMMLSNVYTSIFQELGISISFISKL